ncbi:unnamed protein product [Brassica rapa]|uniref:Uncharacterized protein n=1 Tax=Brassica campestris TaxID=3711 RepID=A0A8D9HD87_BRACM|nr:unnamed protein product [Brassica rapa]
MEFMLTYHEIHHPDSTFLIQETNPFVMNLLREKDNILANDLQVTLTIRDYNQNATVRLDVDLIITDQEGTNRPPTTKEENDICTICFENCNYIHSSNDLESSRHEQHHAELLRFEDEEVEESYQRLRERERSHAYLHNCARAYCSTMDHTYLIPHLRLIMVQWIVQVNIIIMWSEDIKLVELYIKLVEQSNVIDVPGLSYRNISSVASTAIGELVYVANIRLANIHLKGVETGVLVTTYEPILIK